MAKSTMDREKLKSHYDIVVVGSGHNGLIAAAYLVKAGLSVLVLERSDYLGGATASHRVFKDYEAWLSRYSYLVSLLPDKIVSELQLDFKTKKRRTASFTPYVDAKGTHRGLVISNVDEIRSRESMLEMTGTPEAWRDYRRLMDLESAIAGVAWPSMLEPLQTRDAFKAKLTSDIEKEAWASFVERPLGETIERYAKHDVLRGLLMTDGKIGVLTHPHDESLLQNRCFLYHVIGNGTGEWRVPVGGMRALVQEVVGCGSNYGAMMLTDAEVARVELGEKEHTVHFSREGKPCHVQATRVLINAGPRAYCKMLGESWKPVASDEGSVIKINMLLRRLPKVKAEGVSSEEAFAGSFHIDEGYQQMLESYRQASSGEIPDPAPGEMYCHTLTDASILSPELRQAGYQTLTLFGLDMPYRLFGQCHEARKEKVKRLFLAGLNRVCAEPFEGCLARDRAGEICLEIHTPQDIEREVDLDLGNIFHNTLSWFFVENRSEAGRWGVETDHARVYRAGSSAHRGGAVSGIPGRNVAMCIFQELGIPLP